jgi:hypothetical protein
LCEIDDSITFPRCAPRPASNGATQAWIRPAGNLAQAGHAGGIGAFGCACQTAKTRGKTRNSYDPTVIMPEVKGDSFLTGAITVDTGFN